MQNEFIEVIVRKRPITNNNENIVHAHNKYIDVHEMKTKVDLTKCVKTHKYSFDSVYADQSTNNDIYIEKIEPNIYDSLDGNNFICYAYGQTGSGKTHTIFGDSKDIGLIPLTALGIFQLIDNYSNYSLKVSAYEIYNNEIYDLLNKRNKLSVREDHDHKMQISNLIKRDIYDYATFIKIMKNVMMVRNVGISSGNHYSSRSHAIFTFYLSSPQKTSHITFVDLAGSERASQSVCKNYRENSEINKSLLALKECIRAMKNNKKHIPFRSSKLTTVLQGAFTKCENTLMIGTVRSEKTHMVDTINTLHYTSNVKYIKKVQYKSIINLPIIHKTKTKINEFHSKFQESPYIPHSNKQINKVHINKYKCDEFLTSLVKNYKKHVKDMIILSNQDAIILNKLKVLDKTNFKEIKLYKNHICNQLEKKRKIIEAFYLQLSPRV